MRRPPVHWYAEGAGPAVMLINGWTASGLLWPDAFVERLASRYRVIRVDNRGSGWSRTAPHPFTIEDLADDVAGVLAMTGVRRATVVGFSMGGLIGQELALRHPGLVSSLVLVATRPPVPAHATHDLTGFESALGPAGVRPSVAHLRDLWGSFCAPGFAEQHPEVINEILAAIVRRPTPRRSVMAQMRAVAAWGHADRLRELEVATHIVHGTDDPLMPAENAEHLASLIPASRTHLLEGVGHLVPHEAGLALATIIEGAAA